MTSSDTAEHNTITMTSSTVAMQMTYSNVTWSPTRPETSTHSSGAASTARAVLEVTTLLVFFSLSVIGNILVCLVIHRSRRLQSTTNYFVVSLAAADLLLSVVVMPFAVTQELAEIGLAVVFRPPSWACKFIRFCQQLVPASTSFVFVAISVDRFYAVVYPLRLVLTRGRAQRLVLAIWSLAAVLASPALYFYGPGKNGSQCAPFTTAVDDPTDGAAIIYVAMNTSLTFLLPAAVVSAAYTKVGKYIWRIGINGRTFQRTTNPVQRAKVPNIVSLSYESAFVSRSNVRHIASITFD